MIKIHIFFYNQWYLIALDIIETKLFKETKETIKKSISKYRCNRKIERSIKENNNIL